MASFESIASGIVQRSGADVDALAVAAGLQRPVAQPSRWPGCGEAS